MKNPWLWAGYLPASDSNSKTERKVKVDLNDHDSDHSNDSKGEEKNNGFESKGNRERAYDNKMDSRFLNNIGNVNQRDLNNLGEEKDNRTNDKEYISCKEEF
jgi:hypothetical protein